MIPYPETFLDAVAASTAFLGALFLIVSIFSCIRLHTLRIAGISLMFSLSVFSDSTTTYVVAIFLTASVITRLRFIERIAAIVTHNSKYFTPERAPSPLSNDEDYIDKVNSADGDTFSIREASHQTSDPKDPLPSGSNTISMNKRIDVPAAVSVDSAPSQDAGQASQLSAQDRLVRQLGGLGRAYEILAIDRLSRTTGRIFEQNIQMKLKSGLMALDAFSEGKNGLPDILVEVKGISQRTENIVLSSAQRVFTAMTSYKLETRKTIVGVLIIVSQNSIDLSPVARSTLQNLALSQNFSVQLQFYKLSELLTN
jgi:hypothetical protein